MTHDCYMVFDPDGFPAWYTARPTLDEAIYVYCHFLNSLHNRVDVRVWSRCQDIGYECRPVRLTERKD